MDKKRNVVLIIASQMSTKAWNGIRKHSNAQKTQGLARLAKEGIRFEQSYSSFPLSSPARASFFTGLMPYNHGIVDDEESLLHRMGKIPRIESIATLGGCLKDAGYETAYFGKEDAGGYGWTGIDHFGSMKHSKRGMLAEGSVYDSLFVRDAVNFIKGRREKPFYMTLSFVNPHDINRISSGKIKGATFADTQSGRDAGDPYVCPQERAALPVNFDVPVEKGMIKEDDFIYSELKSKDEDSWRRYISGYNLFIENMDWHIEIILNALKEQGLEDDTLVVFTTDHGDMMGSHGIIGSVNFYEESAKIFMIMRCPDMIEPGTTNEEALISSVDLMPTILDFCNVPQPSHLGGQSFKTACRGENVNLHTLFSVNFGGKMVRYQNFKYIESELSGEKYSILFDLAIDSEERINVANDPVYNEVKSYGKILLKDIINPPYI